MCITEVRYDRSKSQTWKFAHIFGYFPNYNWSFNSCNKHGEAIPSPSQILKFCERIPGIPNYIFLQVVINKDLLQVGWRSLLYITRKYFGAFLALPPVHLVNFVRLSDIVKGDGVFPAGLVRGGPGQSSWRSCGRPSRFQTSASSRSSSIVVDPVGPTKGTTALKEENHERSSARLTLLFE